MPFTQSNRYFKNKNQLVTNLTAFLAHSSKDNYFRRYN
jgi:hypothetical protein